MRPYERYAGKMALHTAGILLLLALVMWCRVQGDSHLFEEALGPIAKPIYRLYYATHFILDAVGQRLVGTHGLHESVRMLICIAIAVGLWALVCVAGHFLRRIFAALSTSRAVRRGAVKVVPLSRRQFIFDSGVLAGTLLGCSAAYPVVVAPEAVKTVRLRMAIKDWPEALEGLKAVQISDTHCGKLVSMPYLHGVIAQANALNPDVVLLTGDYVQYRRDDIPRGIEIFRNLNPRLGIAAVMGNHDHAVGPSTTRQSFQEIGVPLIDNTRLYLGADGLRDTPREGDVCIAGVGDLWEDEVDFDAALDGVPAAMPRLLLSHNPDVAEMENAHRVDAVFSGHTHGGQVVIPGLGPMAFTTDFGMKYMAGAVRRALGSGRRLPRCGRSRPARATVLPRRAARDHLRAGLRTRGVPKHRQNPWTGSPARQRLTAQSPQAAYRQ